MAVTATVAAVAGTVYVADKMGDAADAQKAAAERAGQMANQQATAIQDQTAALQAQLEQSRVALAQQSLQTNSLLTAQQSQFETLMTQQQTASASAAARQREEAAAQAQIAEENKNRANQKKPATEAFINKNERAGMTGQSGTLLTGSTGISSASLPLGKSTLLGA
jgi:type IV secretory pathway VirB10-like protein